MQNQLAMGKMWLLEALWIPFGVQVLTNPISVAHCMRVNVFISSVFFIIVIHMGFCV